MFIISAAYQIIKMTNNAMESACVSHSTYFRSRPITSNHIVTNIVVTFNWVKACPWQASKIVLVTCWPNVIIMNFSNRCSLAGVVLRRKKWYNTYLILCILLEPWRHDLTTMLQIIFLRNSGDSKTTAA